MCPGEAQLGQAAAKTEEDVAGPLPLDGDVPYRETDGAYNVHTPAEDDGRPPRAIQYTVARPSVYELLGCLCAKTRFRS